MKNFTRILSVMLVILTAFSVFAISASAAEFTDYYEAPEFIYGDTNYDFNISVKDATQVQKHLAKIITLPDELIESGDVDGNGRLTIGDATLIQKYVAHIIDVFPVEYYPTDYEYIANGSELKLEFTDSSYAEIKITVEVEGFYDIIATSDESDIEFDLMSEDMEYYWSAKNNGENMHIYAKLYPGVYYANVYAADDIGCEVIFKAGISQSEPPFDMDDAELAKELNAGDKIAVKAGKGKYVYKVNLASLDEADQFVVYTEDSGAKAVMTSYDSDYYVTGESEYYEGEGISIAIYNDGVYNFNFLVLEVMEDSEAFTLICDTALGMVEKEAVELNIGETVQVEVEEVFEEFEGETLSYWVGVVMHKFTPENDGYYSFNFKSKAAMMISVSIAELNNIYEGYLFVDMNEEGGKLYDVLWLEGGKEYYFIGMAMLESYEALTFTVLDSNEEEYIEAQNKNSFTDSSEDEVVYREITLGESVLVEFEATDDELVTGDFVFTATEDCTIVLYSQNSSDACVYVLDDMGMTLHMGDSIYTSYVTPSVVNFYYSEDFAVIGTVSEGETVYFSVGSYAEEGDSFYFTVVDEADYVAIDF